MPFKFTVFFVSDLSISHVLSLTWAAHPANPVRLAATKSAAMNSNKKLPYSLWRKIHIYSFGYFTLFSVAVSLLFITITVTGILYNHQHDFEILEKGRISTRFLPDSYQERLDKTRHVQGLAELFPEEATKVPVMWLIKDLHTGDFWGPWGRLFYDLICISLLVLSITGCYLFLKIKIRTKEKSRRNNHEK